MAQLPTRAERPPGPVDWLTLVAATAVAMSWSSAFDQALGPGAVRPWWPAGPDRWPERGLVYLASWSVGLLLIRLRGPRPPMHRLMRQPGAVACMSATAATVVVLAWSTYRSFAELGWTLPRPAGESAGGLGGWLLAAFAAYAHAVRDIAAPRLGATVPPAVLCAWIVLGAGGRWKPEGTWIDRLGMAIGWLWLAEVAVEPFKIGRGPG
ncbi:hypothetical protein EP7_005207 [Isosphaeraceae bacterium EP7]